MRGDDHSAAVEVVGVCRMASPNMHSHAHAHRYVSVPVTEPVVSSTTQARKAELAEGKREHELVALGLHDETAVLIDSLMHGAVVRHSEKLNELGVSPIGRAAVVEDSMSVKTTVTVPSCGDAFSTSVRSCRARLAPGRCSWSEGAHSASGQPSGTRTIRQWLRRPPPAWLPDVRGAATVREGESGGWSAHLI